MPRLRSSLGAAFGAAFLAGACGDGNVVAPRDTVLVTQPQWQWESACCGLAGNERTPATEGFIYNLQFGRNGTVRAFRNDTLIVETDFQVLVSAPEGGDQLTEVLYGDSLRLAPGFPTVLRHMLIVPREGEILLRDSRCADCFGDWRFLAALVTAPRAGGGP